MTAKELAGLLDNSEYPLRLSADLKSQAKEAGLVIVCGASDDLMEFDGAIDAEVGAINRTTVIVDGDGLMPEFEDLVEEGDKDRLRDYFKREGGGRVIETMWCLGHNYSWKYKTDIPHETFEVVKKGQPYGRGIVFALADAAQPAAEDGMPKR